MCEEITRKRTRNTTPRVRVLRKYRIPRSSCGLGFDALFSLSSLVSLPQNAAGRVVGVVRRVLQRGGHQRKRPARAPTLRPPTHATRQSRQAKLRRAIVNGPLLTLRPPGPESSCERDKHEALSSRPTDSLNTLSLKSFRTIKR